MVKQKQNKARIYYIDNLRIVLTLLVVAHHWAISNGAPGDTYYSESSLGPVQTLLMSLFVATNQAFFMGFFFFISAYFVPSSFRKKDGFVFLKERLLRLGLPLVFYILVLSSILIFISKKLGGTYNGGFIEFVLNEGGRSPGPMWFVALLLIFSGLYFIGANYFGFAEPFRFKWIKPKFQVLGFVLLVLLTFFIRIKFPVGTWLTVLGLQPAHLSQYVLCFALGIWAKETGAIEKLHLVLAKRYFVFAQLLVFIALPVLFFLSGAASDYTPLMGGFTWQSFMFVVWEQLVALSLIIALLGLFKRYFNAQNDLLKDLSQNSYAIYIFHGFVLIGFSALFQFYQSSSFLKFVLLLIPVLLFCYLLAKFVRSIPGIKKVL